MNIEFRSAHIVFGYTFINYWIVSRFHNDSVDRNSIQLIWIVNRDGDGDAHKSSRTDRMACTYDMGWLRNRMPN